MRRQILLLLAITHGFVFLLGTAVQEPDLPPSTSAFAGERTTTVNIATVTENGQGSISTVSIDISEGNGRVRLDTDPFIDLDTQASGRTAKQIAEQYTQTSLAEKDITIRFNIDAAQLGGPSAGAAMTLGIIAAIQNRTVPDTAVITGTIQPDGRIGRVGGILEKAMAAGTAGKKTFLVPEGQSSITYYTRKNNSQPDPFGRYSADDYTVQQVDITTMTAQYDMQTIEVSTIEDAVQILE
ncbi:MAG: hypothetical protein MUP66_00360 [Candidatus Nanohaloarchaeota archaeon QJJ-5]|nr:hypothetical protein [Candidatus Nanohaloarchaeota archaeon QJJ-5]